MDASEKTMSKVSLETIDAQKHKLRWREGGKHRQRTVNDSKRKAERIRAAIEDRLAAGIADSSRVTVADLGKLYLADRAPRVSDKTIKDYRDQWKRIVLPYLGGYRLDRLQPFNIDDWLAELDKAGVGRESQRKALTRLRSALKFATRRRMVAVNVALDVEMPEKPAKRPIVVTSPTDVERMRANALADGHDRDALIYSLGFYLGLRPGEIFGLQASALDGAKLTIDQRRTLKLEVVGGKVKERSQLETGSKTNTIREVDVPEVVLNEMREYIDGDGLLFPNRKGLPLTDSQYRSWVRNRFNKHRVSEKATPYSMRHSAASLLILSGRSINYIARQLGHSATESLKTYQHVMDDLEFEERIPVNKNIVRARRQVRREHSRLKAVG